MVTLSVAKIAQYVRSEEDAKPTNQRRLEGVGHGNQVSVGDVAPAIVVGPNNDKASSFNGQAFLDGNDVIWITSVPYDATSTPGTWH